MASYLVTVAEGIKTHLAAGGPYVITPDFERLWVPYFERLDIGTDTKVVVVPNGATQQQLTREKRRNDIIIDVYVQKAVDWQVVAEGDLVSELAEQINERVQTLASVAFGSEQVGRVGVTFEPFVVTEHLLEFRVFTSRITSRWLLAK